MVRLVMQRPRAASDRRAYTCIRSSHVQQGGTPEQIDEAGVANGSCSENWATQMMVGPGSRGGDGACKGENGAITSHVTNSCESRKTVARRQWVVKTWRGQEVTKKDTSCEKWLVKGESQAGDRAD